MPSTIALSNACVEGGHCIGNLHHPCVAKETRDQTCGLLNIFVYAHVVVLSSALVRGAALCSRPRSTWSPLAGQSA